MDFNSDYLTRQIIAYIGNKRRLLKLIYQAIENCVPEIKPGLKFFDVFAGSGIVSRLAKELRFEVITNDWETYSFILNSGFIKTNKKEIPEIFGSRKDFLDLLKSLNELPDPADDDCYVSKYYAPKSFNIDDADFRKERLFYTRDNALRIDKIRNYIDSHYPEKTRAKARNILLGILLYEAATHTNTSGVFKAFHKGFGGHNRDAMKRILSPVCMTEPVLIDSDFPAHVYREDANHLVKKITGIDIAYLDPPYNQHQYGSNYHLLNSIALWDKIPAPLLLNEKNELKEKAAIRKDWINTKSNYCYRGAASSSFADLIENLDAKKILVSYSTDGIIPFDVMKDICAAKGKMSVITNEYTKYRGGKQSNKRLNTNIEMIITIDTEKKSTVHSVKKAEAIIKKRELLLMFTHRYSFSKFTAQGVPADGNVLVFDTGKRKLLVPSNCHFELYPVGEIEELSLEETIKLHGLLSSCICLSREEELAEIISKIEGGAENSLYFAKLIPGILKKLAHKKNRERFYFWLGEIKKLEGVQSGLYSVVKEKIEAVEHLAEKRFCN